MAHLPPSVIFSPSIARQQLTTAKDWNYVDYWLASKLQGKVPTFERNNDTLKALLALAALNESADEECNLLAAVEEKALRDIQSEIAADDAHGELLDDLDKTLTREGQISLDALANLSVVLNQPIPLVEQIGRSLLDIKITSNDLEQTSDRTTVLEKHLDMELENINTVIKDLQSEAYQLHTDPTKNTVENQRKTKVLAAKLPELQERATSFNASAGQSNITIGEIKMEEDKFRNMMLSVKELESKTRSYHGLPDDVDLARLELEAVRAELRDLTILRDRMFEGLVERASPQKTR